MAENDNLPGDPPPPDQAETEGRYTRNLSAAARKRILARARAIDRILEHEDDPEDA